MKYILILGTIVAIGWVAYTRVMASPIEAQTCQRVEMLCGEMSQSDMASCQSDLRDIESMLGADTTTQVSDCVTESDTCEAALSCMTSEVGRSAQSGLFKAPGVASDE